jgi:hypothetical protein
VIQCLYVKRFDLEGGATMMYDALAYERQRQEQADIRRGLAHAQVHEPRRARLRQHHRRQGALRRRFSVTASF